MIYEINQGESLFLSYSLDRHTDLSSYTCQVQVRSSDNNSLIQEQYFIDYVNNQKSFIGYLDVSDTNDLLAGTYNLTAKILNSIGDMAKQFHDELIIETALVQPNLVAIEALVSFAEAQPTPETQEAAQIAVNQMPVSSQKTAFQVRLDALDPEVANVEAARALVVIAEAYRWLATEQAAAQAASDALISTIEQAALTARLDAINDKVAAETATEQAQYSTLQTDIDTAQALILVLGAEDQILLQERLDLIVVIARLIPAQAISPDVVTPYLSRQNLRVRSPGYPARFKLDSEINQFDGWAAVSSTGKTLTTARSMWGIGDEATLLAAEDQGQGGLTTVLCGQRVYYNGSIQSGNGSNYVIAVNYQTNPHVYVIDVDLNSVVFDQILPITTPVTFLINEDINTDQEREWYFQLNTANDDNNRPFTVDVDTLLTNYGADTTGLILGWGTESTRPSPAGSVALTITTTPPAPVIGVPIVLNATCTDGDGVDRASDIRWFNDFINWNKTAEAFVDGDELTFTPEIEGSYRIRATYEDTYGNQYEDSITILVDDTYTHTGNTVFDPARSNVGIASLVANTVRFETSDPFKIAAVANHANWGTFRYYEVTVNAPNGQFGVGLTSLLNTTPLAPNAVMWSGTSAGTTPQDGAGAFSVLTFAAGGALQQQWISGSNLTPTGNNFFLPNNNSTFHLNGGTVGVLVDNRNKDEPPTVYLIDEDAAVAGVSRVARVFSLWNCRTPVAPVVYANTPSSLVGSGVDLTLNGGGNGAFLYDPRPALTAIGVDNTGLEYGWTTSELQP